MCKCAKRKIIMKIQLAKKPKRRSCGLIRQFNCSRSVDSRSYVDSTIQVVRPLSFRHTSQTFFFVPAARRLDRFSAARNSGYINETNTKFLNFRRITRRENLLTMRHDEFKSCHVDKRFTQNRKQSDIKTSNNMEILQSTYSVQYDAQNINRHTVFSHARTMQELDRHTVLSANKSNVEFLACITQHAGPFGYPVESSPSRDTLIQLIRTLVLY